MQTPAVFLEVATGRWFAWVGTANVLPLKERIRTNMDPHKLEELRFLASFIRTTAQANIACNDQRSSAFYVMLRTASQQLLKIAHELGASNNTGLIKSVNELLPEHDQHLARYQAWYPEKIEPHLQ